MMKRNNDHQYSNISSFKDFRREKEMLVLKGKIVDAKLELAYLKAKQVFSASNLIISFAKEFIRLKVSQFFGNRPEKTDKEDNL